jgi:hypothetical protein
MLDLRFSVIQQIKLRRAQELRNKADNSNLKLKVFKFIVLNPLSGWHQAGAE